MRLLGLLLVQWLRLADLLQAPGVSKAIVPALHSLVLELLSLVGQYMSRHEHFTAAYIEASGNAVASAAKLVLAVAELALAQQEAAFRAVQGRGLSALISILAVSVKPAMVPHAPQELEGCESIASNIFRCGAVRHCPAHLASAAYWIVCSHAVLTPLPAICAGTMPSLQ